MNDIVSLNSRQLKTATRSLGVATKAEAVGSEIQRSQYRGTGLRTLRPGRMAGWWNLSP